MSRRFNAKQRDALWLAAGGRCSLCGVELGEDFHADHIVPFSKGGETDVLNGQALCPRCNAMKGDGMADELRTWQKEFLKRYDKTSSADFLLVACPAAGKTHAALAATKRLVDDEVVRRVCIVTHTDHLKTQWRRAAKQHGIDLIRDHPSMERFTVPHEDFHGMVVTYQQVASNPEHFRACCTSSMIVILDEIHHCSDEKNQAWGTAIRHAFENATRRLSLSGTPFRSDRMRIPFITYDKEGACVADHTYTYGEALTHDICRSLHFPSYDGLQQWHFRGQIHEADFSEDLDEDDANKRLATAVKPDLEWMQSVLAAATDRVDGLRSGCDCDADGDAAGLVIATDVRSANAIARSLPDSVVVVYEDNGAADKLKGFQDGNGKWLVSVKMVSEGVDIPRLRVLVYATTTTTELFFRQAAGRIMRGNRDETAFFYFPKDKRLSDTAQAIRDERKHQIIEEIEQRELDWDRDGPDRPPSDFAAIAAEGTASDVYTPNSVVTQEELAEAQRVIDKVGGVWPPAARVAELLRASGRTSTAVAPSVSVPREKCREEIHHDLRRANNKAVAEWVREQGGDKSLYGKANRKLNQRYGKDEIGECTIEELRDRLMEIKRCILNGYQPS